MLLKQAAARVLPEQIIKRRKKGFAIQLSRWLNGPLHERVRDVVYSSPIWQIGVMAQDVEKVVPDAVQEVGGWKAVNLNTATKYAADLARFLEEAA